MLLIYLDEQALSGGERAHCYQESAELAHQLKASGQYLGTAPLHPTSTANSVRMREGKRLVTDGQDNHANPGNILGGAIWHGRRTLRHCVDGDLRGGEGGVTLIVPGGPPAEGDPKRQFPGAVVFSLGGDRDSIFSRSG